MKCNGCGSCVLSDGFKVVYDLVFDKEIYIFYCRIDQKYYYETAATICKKYTPRPGPPIKNGSLPSI